MKSNTAKFMTRLQAKKLFPKRELTPEVEEAINKHLWYIGAAVIKGKIEKRGSDINIGINQCVMDAYCLSVEGFPTLALEMLDMHGLGKGRLPNTP